MPIKKKAVDNLTEQTNSILEELPQIAKNDAYAQIDYSTMHSAKLDSLLLALQNVHSLNRANSIAEQFYLTAGIKGLAFYDENGKIPTKEKPLNNTEVITHSIGIPENGECLHIVYARHDIAEVLSLVHIGVAAVSINLAHKGNIDIPLKTAPFVFIKHMA